MIFKVSLEMNAITARGARRKFGKRWKRVNLKAETNAISMYSSFSRK